MQNLAVGGVYWHDDHISHPKASWFDKAPRKNVSGNPIINSVDASQDEAHAKQLSEENEQLKAEVQRLKKALRDPSA